MNDFVDEKYSSSDSTKSTTSSRRNTNPTNIYVMFDDMPVAAGTRKKQSETA